MKMTTICGAMNAIYYFCSKRLSCFNYTLVKKQNPILFPTPTSTPTTPTPTTPTKTISKSQVGIISWKDAIPFVPPVNSGEVIKVYDGDTITIATYLPYNNSPLYRFSVRLHGIDAPEIKGKTEDEKTAAKVSQQALESLILHKNVTLQDVGTEKYGRILAKVFYNEINLSEWMLKHNYAIPYDGGTKKGPDSWLDYQATGIIQ